MKKILLPLISLFAFIFECHSQNPMQERDFSGTYTLWRAPGTNMNKKVKDGIKVQCSQVKSVLKVYSDLKSYGGDRVDWEYISEGTEQNVEKLTHARMGFGGWPDWNTGRNYIEVEEGMLVFFEGNPSYVNSGECSADQLKEVTFVLYNNKKLETYLDLPKIKAKVSSMLIEICNITKDKNPVVKDIRGMNSIPEGAVTDYSKGKKLEGKYYAWRNEQTALRYTYTTEQAVDLVDFGDHLEIEGKMLKVKKFKTIWDNNDKFMKIEQLSGVKILKANSSNGDNGYGLGTHFLVEIEDGIIAMVRDIGYNYFTKSEPCKANVDNIDYILYKSLDACQSSQLGQIKTKLRQVLDNACSKYTATLDGPKSALPLMLPVHANTDTDVEAMAWDAVNAFYKKQGWKEELLGCYIASADWSYAYDKRLVNGVYEKIIVSRFKNGVVFYKTSTGQYYCRGISFAQDVVAGHTKGVNFQTKTLYCPGVLDGGAAPGTEFSLQNLTEAEMAPHRR